MTTFMIPDMFISSVTNQKSHGCCLAVTLADMVGTILKMTGEESIDLALSPQPLIDGDIKTPFSLQNFCREVGFESVTTYPFTRVKRDKWVLEEYNERPYTKYYIQDLQFIEKKNDNVDEIKRHILQNFGPNGKCYPILCAMDMGDFGNSEVAKKIALSDTPYHPPPKKAADSSPDKKKKKVAKPKSKPKPRPKSEPDHAMLIVGLDTTNEDAGKHYCKVKSSYGKKWGVDGFSKVGLECFNYIMLPKYEKVEEEPAPTQLDKETDLNVLEKCVLASGLPLFAEIEDIKHHFNNLSIKEAVEVKRVCFVSRDDLTYSRSAIIEMRSRQEVDRVLEGEPKPKILSIKAALRRYRGMESLSSVYSSGKFIMTLTYPSYKGMTERQFYEYMEVICHPYSTIELLKDNYLLNVEDRERASTNLEGDVKSICLIPLKEE